MKTRNLTKCAMFGALICICSWLCIPMGDTAITLQTFAAALALLVLGGKWGTVSIFLWLAMGAVGLPVFSGFRGGIGHLLGTTGGYLWGFLLGALIFWVISSFLGEKRRILLCILVAISSYICGSLWFWRIFTDGSIASLGLVFLKCVAPFLIPDGLKIALAVHISRRLKA